MSPFSFFKYPSISVEPRLAKESLSKLSLMRSWGRELHSYGKGGSID
jgi:hypothetical protein